MTKAITLKENEVKQLPLTALQLDPENIRKTFDPESLKGLAADIKLRGVEQPITVTQNGKGYVIKHGARRFMAAQLAKLKTVPCILGKKETGDDAEFKRLADQWAENMQREDLNPIDIAEFFKTCRDDYNMVAKQIPDYLKSYGIKCDYNESTIRGMIRLVELPDWAKDYIRAGKLTASHGRALLPALKSPNVMKDLQKEIDNYCSVTLGRLESLENHEILTVNNLMESVEGWFRKHHPRADTFRSNYLSDDKRVLYDISKLDKDTLEKLNTVELNDGGGQKEQYILNTQLHQELQKKAKAEIAARGKGKPSSTSSSTSSKSTSSRHSGERQNPVDKDSKPEVKTEASQERLQNWLHLYLAKWCMEKFHSMTPEQRAPIFQNILLWCATNCSSNNIPAHIHNNFFDEVRKTLTLEYPHTFSDFLNSTHTIEHVQNVIVENLLKPQDENNDFTNLPIEFDNIAHLAVHLGFNIDKDITIDAAFAEMYTGAGIEKIVYEAKLETYRNGKGVKGIDEFRFSYYSKTAEKRLWLAAVAGKLGTPKAVKQLWKDTLE